MSKRYQRVLQMRCISVVQNRFHLAGLRVGGGREGGRLVKRRWRWTLAWKCFQLSVARKALIKGESSMIPRERSQVVMLCANEGDRVAERWRMSRKRRAERLRCGIVSGGPVLVRW